jgi:hypothetical protein
MNQKKNLEKRPEHASSNLEELLKNITPDIHRLLKVAVELGRWENGDKLTEEQKALCLQAVIAYDEHYLAPEKRVGFISRKKTGRSGKDINNNVAQKNNNGVYSDD